MQYYKVTNLSVRPTHMTWNKALLTDEQLQAYEAFKNSPDYLGFDDQDEIQKKKVVEAVKMRAFFDGFNEDVRIKVYDRDKDGAKVRYEWKFVIGPNTEELIKKGDLSLARRVCEEFEVTPLRDDTIAVLGDKLKSKFGANVRILTATQWLESGLRDREQKEIRFKLKPGETTARIVNEGYLQAVEMTDVEVEEWYENETKKVKEEAAKLEVKVTPKAAAKK